MKLKILAQSIGVIGFLIPKMMDLKRLQFQSSNVLVYRFNLSRTGTAGKTKNYFPEINTGG